jgi:hypothetical protein
MKSIEIIIGEITIEWKADKENYVKKSITSDAYIGTSKHFPGVKVRIRTKKAENFDPGNLSWYIYGRVEKINYPHQDSEDEMIIVDFAHPATPSHVPKEHIHLATE